MDLTRVGRVVMSPGKKRSIFDLALNNPRRAGQRRPCTEEDVGTAAAGVLQRCCSGKLNVGWCYEVSRGAHAGALHCEPDLALQPLYEVRGCAAARSRGDHPFLG